MEYLCNRNATTQWGAINNGQDQFYAAVLVFKAVQFEQIGDVSLASM